MNVLAETVTERFSLYNADCVEVLRALPDASMHYSVFSPPFASLYTYSNSPRDLGNCRSSEEFFGHFDYVITEIHRILKPGRLVSMHCMDLPLTKGVHGVIGLQDFPGGLIKSAEKAGFVFHSRVTIGKNPVTQMQRTKSIRLLHKQLKKDSAMSGQGLADYVVTMRKRDANEEPITHTDESFPVALWQRYADPVWSDIDESDTLNFRNTGAREHEDEKHICPLQLGVIRRCVQLWTNPNDIVLSPFTGIGSEGYVSLQEGRRFCGAELKKSYYEQAARNLREAQTVKQHSLFGGAA